MVQRSLKELYWGIYESESELVDVPWKYVCLPDFDLAIIRRHVGWIKPLIWSKIIVRAVHVALFKMCTQTYVQLGVEELLSLNIHAIDDADPKMC